MTNTITTKPFASQAQARWAFATGQPWARRWAHESPGGKKRWFRRLPRKKKSYTLDDLERVALKADSTPDEIASVAALVPGLATLKGEQIAPGITRIRGDLCNVHGKYGSCSAAIGGEKPKRVAPATGKRKPKRTARGRAAKPKKTDAERAQERDAQRQQNRESVKQRMAETDTGLGPAGFDALMAFANGQPPTGQMAQGLAAMGLAEQAADGSYRMTPTGHAVVNAANAGDYQRAIDAISRGTDTASRRQQATTDRERRRTETEQRRTQAQADRERRRQEVEQRRQARSGGGSSGGGGKPTGEKPAPRPKRIPRSSPGGASGGSRGGNRGPSKPNIPPMPKLPKPTQPSTQERQQQNRESVKRRMAENDAGLSPSGFDALMAFADGKQPAPALADGLVSMGLAERNQDGTYRLTTAARTVVEAANVGNYQRAVDAIARAMEGAGKKKATGGAPIRRAPVTAIGISGNPGNPSKPLSQTHAARALSRAHYTMPSLTVLKDKVGRYRWVLFSSNAYRDRDGEIVSTKALEADCDRADASRAYGPLRWWHVPGVDIGDCDFNAMHGRILIESGTFRDERIGAAVARKAKDLQVSIGFIHPPDQPDAAGVFHIIRRFERSLVPAGKASNPFTHVLVQEQPTMATVKERLEELTRLLGDSALVQRVLQAAETTQKTIDEQGVAYKSDDAPTVYIAPDGTQGLIQDGQFVALKAVEPPVVETEEKAPPEGEMDAAMSPEDEGGLTLSPEDLTAIGQAVASAIAPLVGALDIESKMRGHMDAMRGGVDELKTMFGGYQKQKDSEAADQAATIATLKAAIEKSDQERADFAARLAELEGDQPIALKNGYRASGDPATVRKKEGDGDTPPDQPPPANPFADMQQFIMGLSANGTQPGN